MMNDQSYPQGELRFRCSETFPANPGDSWVVRGIGGEPDERWKVTRREGRTFFARVQEVRRNR